VFSVRSMLEVTQCSVEGVLGGSIRTALLRMYYCASYMREQVIERIPALQESVDLGNGVRLDRFGKFRHLGGYAKWRCEFVISGESSFCMGKELYQGS